MIVSHAQKLAVEYEYTYDDEMPLDVLLEEMSLFFQSYTSKPASRPFGCTLLIGHLDDYPCKMYQIDPSGSVTDLGKFGSIGHESNIITQRLQLGYNETNSMDLSQNDIEEIAINALLHSEKGISSDEMDNRNQVYLVGLFTKKDGLLCSSIVK